MKVSLNYIKKFLDFELPDADQVVDRIGTQLGAVDEGVFSLREMYQSAVVVKVIDCNPIEGSDHLNLCKIDDGQKVSKDIERGEGGLIQVVCGAPNVKAGLMVAWLPPGSVVPSTYNKEPFTLEARSLRGQISYGMLASPKELAIGDSHEGLLIIDKDCSPGDSFADLYDLNDTVIDIENKMFTHRPDCFGLIGVARELAGIFNQPFSSPDWYLKASDLNPVSDNLKPISVINEIAELVPRFCAVTIDNIEVGPSPIEIQSYLSRMGIRPVNNIVDATNLTMIETGQPLHAYDYDKLTKLSGGKAEITVRYPRPDETITLLNSKVVKPRSESIMIATGNQLIGLAGIMGSESSEVDDSTTTIVLESACFDMYSIRRSSMELGIFSDAVTRFNKGQSPLQNRIVLSKCATLINSLTDGMAVVASEVVDINKLPETTINRNSLYPEVVVETDYVNSRLGSNLEPRDMARLLENVECEVTVDGTKLSVRAPFWRTDIEIREDIVEEVGRIYGYDKLKPKLLTRKLSLPDKNRSIELKSRLRHLLAEAGANELLNYSFISRSLIESSNQDPNVAFEIANSLSPELNFYRLSLTPSLISKVHANIKDGFTKFAIFELGTYHQVDHYGDQEEHLPKEYESLGLTYASKTEEAGAAYYKSKTYLSYICQKFNLEDLTYKPLKDALQDLDPSLIQMSRPFDKDRSALLVAKDGGQFGVVGEYLQSVKSKLKLPKYTSGFEVSLDLFKAGNVSSVYTKISRYPEVKQDVTLRVASSLNYQELDGFLRLKLSELKEQSSFFKLTASSIFQAKDSADFKNYSFKLVIGDYLRTLSDANVNQLLDEVAEAASTKFKAERI
jgi:phenylalanyl-tRNA synthetase beta chain